MVVELYDIIAIVCCISFVFIAYGVYQTLKQVRSTLQETEKTMIEVREKTLKNVEGVTHNLKDLTQDINGKSKKLDPAFDAVEKVSNLSNVVKKGYHMWQNKK